MAKIGHLYLENGSWIGVQIVSKSWVENSTKNHSPTPFDFYGYQWRIHLNGYSALGYLAQRIYNVPEYNLSFIMTANLADVYAADLLVNNVVIPGIIS
jgi:CubicO group peptidase (beta-lactamase class C family)